MEEYQQAFRIIQHLSSKYHLLLLHLLFSTFQELNMQVSRKMIKPLNPNPLFLI